MFIKLFLILSSLILTSLAFSLDSKTERNAFQAPSSQSSPLAENNNASAKKILEKTALPNIAEENSIPEALNKEYLQLQEEQNYNHYYIEGNALLGWPIIPFKWSATILGETQSFNGMSEPQQWLNFSIAAGYQWNRFLAIELGYTKLADFAIKQFGSLIQALKSEDLEDKTSNLDLDLDG
jgi:hypothetical protein